MAASEKQLALEDTKPDLEPSSRGDHLAFAELLVDVEKRIAESWLKLAEVGKKRTTVAAVPRASVAAPRTTMKCPQELQCDISLNVPRYFAIELPKFEWEFGYGMRLKVAVRCLNRKCKLWAYGSDYRSKPSARNSCCSVEGKEAGVLVWIGRIPKEYTESTFGLSVLVKSTCAQGGQRKIAITTLAEVVHVGVGKEKRISYMFTETQVSTGFGF